MMTRESQIKASLPSINSYPIDIVGNCIDDNILDNHPEMALYPEVSKLVESVGRKHASKIIWSHILLRDPRRFINGRMLFDDKKDFIVKNYYPVDWVSYKAIDEFVINRVLVNDDVIYYMRLQEQVDIDIRTIDLKKGLDIKKKVENKKQLNSFKNKVFSVLNEGKRKAMTTGAKQPGGKSMLRGSKA